MCRFLGCDTYLVLRVVVFKSTEVEANLCMLFYRLCIYDVGDPVLKRGGGIPLINLTPTHLRDFHNLESGFPTPYALGFLWFSELR